MAWPDSQSRRVALVVQNAQVAGSGTHSAFPVLLTAANLPAELLDTGDSNAPQVDGGDIRFASDEDGVSQLPFDIVSFSPTSGGTGATAEIWVKVDLNTTTDTTFYMAWKTAGTTSAPAVTDPNGRNACWAGAELAVLMEDVTPVDRTGNHTLTVAGTLTSIDGPFGKALSFADNASLTNTDSAILTLPTGHDFTLDIVCRRATAGSNNAAFGWDGTDDIYGYPIDAGEEFRVFWRDMGGNIVDAASSPAGQFNFHSLTSRGPADHEAYAAGASIATSSGSGTAGPFTNFTIGGGDGTSQSFEGDIAQVIVWKSARSDDWITTQYNNQNSPATFIIEGTPEDVGGGGGETAVGHGLLLGRSRNKLVHAF